MIMGFVIWSLIAVMFVGIGINCCKSEEAVGFFTFTKPPVIDNIKGYNHAVAVLWFVSAVVYEIIGVPLLFLEQNSPLFIPVFFAMILWLIGLMVAYVKIEAKYKKKI